MDVADREPAGCVQQEHEAPLQLESKPVANDLIIKEEGVFTSLWSSIRDVFFPVKLPPLVLESKPIAVVDRMKMKQNPPATAICGCDLWSGDSADCVAAA